MSESRWILFRIHRQPGIHPGVEPAVEWMDILPTAIRELLCHTGTRSFVRSRAVSDDHAIVRDLLEVLIHFAGGNPDRTRKLLVRFRPCLRISRIDKRERLSPVQPFANLIYCNSCCLHNSHLSQDSGTRISRSEQICLAGAEMN